MKLLDHKFYFAKEHHLFAIDIIRIITGILIFYNGISILNNPELLSEIVKDSQIAGLIIILGHHVIFSLLVGGLFITIGILTRVALIFQIPVYLSIIWLYLSGYIIHQAFDLFYLIIIQISIIFLLISGPGKYSIDYLKWGK